MAEQMTLEQVRDIIERSAKKLCNCGACKESKLRKEVYDVLNSSHLNAAKGEAVAWRYRFYGSQGWVYATAGEELVCGLPLICSQPLYAHPAPPDVVRDAERYRKLLALMDESDPVSNETSTIRNIIDDLINLGSECLNLYLDARAAREGGE